MEDLTKVQDINKVDNDLNNQEITDWDIQTFKKITSTELTDEQKAVIINPPIVCSDQESVLALHWHPEFIPMDMIVQRIHASFPNMKDSLMIPTQHNVIMTLNGYSGVEVDCFSKAFNRKVQLLLHFNESKVAKADTLKSMLAHTYKYRTGQLFEFIETILDPRFEDRLQKAADGSGADIDLIDFVRIQTSKLKTLINKYDNSIPREMIRNKLLINYFDALKDHYEDSYMDQTIHFLRAVKRIVKANFSTDYFYRTSEIIEEVRSLGGCIVIPHPEQFWPILLADYDVDGYEVWNPQSRKYTDFLINVVHRQNQTHKGKEKPILITMGDDCHMGEKVKATNRQDTEKVRREIGIQPAWDDPLIRRSLDLTSIDRQKVIQEYRNRLN